MLYLARFCVGLAFTVILLGAYTRLKDAGLGCPDWPGCYGNWFLPQSAEALNASQALYPTAPIEQHKAWTEMVHRYFAGSLGFCILILTCLSLKKAAQSHFSKLLPVALLLLVMFQGLLGMWTVTLKLLPIVVMGHLIGGFACLTLLWWLMLQLQPKASMSFPQTRLYPKLTILAMTLLALQIMLGAWTSANYAALVCPNFPNCGDALWPHFDWQAFNLFGASALEKPIDFMSYPARVTIHMFHRLGALINVLVLSFLIFKLWRPFRKTAHALSMLLAIQVILGITNVVKTLPLANAVLHNGVAALLWLALFTLWYQQRIKLKEQAYA
jgi:heme a synthase